MKTDLARYIADLLSIRQYLHDMINTGAGLLGANGFNIQRHAVQEEINARIKDLVEELADAATAVPEQKADDKA